MSESRRSKMRRNASGDPSRPCVNGSLAQHAASGRPSGDIFGVESQRVPQVFVCTIDYVLSRTKCFYKRVAICPPQRCSPRVQCRAESAMEESPAPVAVAEDAVAMEIDETATDAQETPQQPAAAPALDGEPAALADSAPADAADATEHAGGAQMESVGVANGVAEATNGIADATSDTPKQDPFPKQDALPKQDPFLLLQHHVSHQRKGKEKKPPRASQQGQSPSNRAQLSSVPSSGAARLSLSLPSLRSPLATHTMQIYIYIIYIYI